MNQDKIFHNYELIKRNSSGIYINKYEDYKNRRIIISQNKKLNSMNNELNILMIPLG